MGLFQGVMGLFKPKIVKEIDGRAWGYLVQEHGFNVDTLTKDIRCVNKSGLKDGCEVSFLRIFSLRDVEKQGITITGWETFDQHPELIMFEGYHDFRNKARLEKKNGPKAR